MLATASSSAASHVYVPKAPASRMAQNSNGLQENAAYTEANFTMPLDHFDRSGNSTTFPVRYLYDNQHVDAADK